MNLNNKKAKKPIPVEHPATLELDENTLGNVSGGATVQDEVVDSGLISMDENAIVIDNHII